MKSEAASPDRTQGGKRRCTILPFERNSRFSEVIFTEKNKKGTGTDKKGGERVSMETERLLLRKWCPADADSLYEYARDVAVGPIAGWRPHKSRGESLAVIRNILCGAECYAVCDKRSGRAIGSVELMLNGHTGKTEGARECELGYWLGKPFWGRGYMTEAARELLRRAFEELGMEKVICGYYEGNERSRRVQEKLGFVYHYTSENSSVPLLNEIRVEYVNVLTKERWTELKSK